MLFCGQQSPQLVVDELMSECAQLINEEEPCPNSMGHQRKLSSASTFHAQVCFLDPRVMSSGQGFCFNDWNTLTVCPVCHPHACCPAYDYFTGCILLQLHSTLQFGRTEGASMCGSVGRSKTLEMSRVVSSTAQSELNKMWDSFPTGSHFHSLPQSESVVTSGVFGTGPASAVSGGRSFAVSAEHSSFKSGALPTPAHERYGGPL